MDLNHLVVFQAVVEAGSFTAAARRLKLDKARVSRVIAALEAELGARLFARSSRSMRLTPEGATLSGRVASPLAELQSSVAALPDRTLAPSGEVVLTTTPDLARALLAEHVAGLRLRFPAVRLRVLLGHDVRSLPAEGIDLALRVGRPASSAVVARRLFELEAGFFAAPSYLERRPAPRALGDLAGHDGLWPPALQGRRSFSVAAKGRPPRPAAVECDDFGFIAAVARRGAGVALLPLFLAERDVREGSLVRVLPEVALGGAPLFLVSRAERPLPPRVDAVRRYLLAVLRRPA